MKSLDVLIVGGGPAGIASALFLKQAAAELQVRVLEKEDYPREKYCAGGVGARADKLLGSIGVSVDVPSQWVSGVAFRAMQETRVVRDGTIGRVVRRIEFDHALAKIALERGVDVSTGQRVTHVRRVGAELEVDTERQTFRTRVLLGADGVTSVVRRALGFQPGPYRAQALELDTEPVESDLPRDVLLFDASRRDLPGYYWDFPTIVAGRELVCRGVYLLRQGDGPAPQIQDVLEQELAARGLALKNYRKKRFAERGFDLHCPMSRPGVLLVGEAAGIDPVTGEGIAQAIQYGAVAGRYLARKFAEHDLTFADWRHEVNATMIGRDLWVRTLGAPIFYGRYRPYVERFLLDTPAFIRVGLQHFAGKKWSKPNLGVALSRALIHTLKSGFTSAEDLVFEPGRITS